MSQKQKNSAVKVVFFVDDFKGGAGNVIQILAKGLHQRGYRVSVCCVGGMNESRRDLESIKVSRILSRHKNHLKYIDFFVGIKRCIKEEKPDCIISFLFGVSALVGLAMGCRRIHFITSERSDPFALKPHGLVVSLVRMAYRKADAVVVLFDAFKMLDDGRSFDKAVTIPNPVPAAPAPTIKRNGNGLRFITVANDSPAKGLDLLIKAFAIGTATTSDATLRIYGAYTGERLQNMIRFYHMQDRIQLMGYTLDVDVAFREADVYIMPSRHEGFPNSLCEAMAAGKACIAFACHPGIADIIEDGVDGILVPAEDCKKLAEAIKYVIEHPEYIDRYGERARSIAQRYSVESVLDAWDNLITKYSK